MPRAPSPKPAFRRRDLGCHASQVRSGRGPRGYRCGDAATICQREPIGKLPCGFVRGRPVKRHHGCRYARRAQELRAPSVADGHHFDEIRAATDGFFETMNGHGAVSAFGDLFRRRACLRPRSSWEPFARGGWRLILRNGLRGSSEAPHEGGIHSVYQPRLSNRHAEKNFLRAQVLNKICTKRPQLFHNARRSKHASAEIARGYNRTPATTS